MNTKLYLRNYTVADAKSCWLLFHNTVRRINCRDYTPEQVDAWANADIDPEPWFQRFDGKVAYVVESEDEILGFADLTCDGYLDRLFVSADHQRQGIAAMLMDAIELTAEENKFPRIYTQASITAEPFFLSRGFTVVTEQTVECRGVKMTSLLMELIFAAWDER